MDSLGIEIDRQLFITCRLCLEDNGIYQIVPSVQEQINYCFGIVVEHFDGLPQLLCKKCKLLLNEYSMHKKSFIEKQETLKKKLEEKVKKNNVPVPDQPHSNSTGAVEKVDSDSSKSKVRKKYSKKRNRIESTSSSDSSSTPLLLKKKTKHDNEKNFITSDFSRRWQNLYSKQFVCRCCSKTYKNKFSVYKHYKGNHVLIRANYHKILDAKFTVSLEKLDNKQNLTRLANTVVLNKEKIVQDEGNPFYYVVFTLKNKSYKNDDQSRPASASSKCVNSDSSDDAFVTKNKKNKFRLDSRSSTDTVFIGDNDNTNVNEENTKIKNEDSNIKIDEGKSFEPKDTICIDDSSESEAESNKELVNGFQKTKSANNKTDLVKYTDEKEVNKIISDIITVCRKKYEARKTIENSSLKNKILNVGRKILNKNGFHNCLGLIRYLEHQNLHITWEKSYPNQATSSKGANFVRILIRTCKKTETSTEETGWMDLETDENTTSISSVQSAASLSKSDITQSQVITTSPIQHMQILKKIPEPTVPKVVQNAQSIIVQPPMEMDQAVLYANVVEDSSAKKLLNTAPVANPKQLPKKTNFNDTKSTLVSNKTNVNNDTISEHIDESNMVMPVITSTTSLANLNNIDKPAPRIKVKPVSELMKPANDINTAANQSSVNNVWGFGLIQAETIKDNNLNIYVPNNLVSEIQTQSAPLPNVIFPSSNEEKKANDSIILDTVDFPNTKTDSPFQYFRNLLFLHDIILNEANAPITTDYMCLLKFKVQFKQENKNLTLCLSLYCSGNKFCMSVKDGKLFNIDTATMSANWQWEIMKVFQGVVMNKILLTAQKHGTDVYNKTKTFLYYLKSITQKQPENIRKI